MPVIDNAPIGCPVTNEYCGPEIVVGLVRAMGDLDAENRAEFNKAEENT